MKKELFSLGIQPFFLALVILFPLTAALRFFLFTGFFIQGQGSADLRAFFNFIPRLALFAIPSLIVPLWGRTQAETDPLAPVKEGTLAASKATAAFIAWTILLLPTVFVPVTVSFFGNPDWGSVLTSYGLLLLFGFYACALGTFFSLLTPSRGASYFCTVSILLLSLATSLLPRVTDISPAVGKALNALSPLWHLDAAFKGIADSRDIVFFLASGFLWIGAGAALLRYRRGGGKPPGILTFPRLFFAAGALLFLIFPQRTDFSRNKAFSLSPYTAELLQSLENTLHITYFVSPEVTVLYPQAQNIQDFAQSYAASSKGKVTFTVKKPDPEVMTRLGISRRQVEKAGRGKTELVDIYSALTLEYGEGEHFSSAVVPFVLLPEAVEYELDRRVLNLLKGNTPAVFMLPGNGLTIEDDYSYAEAWVRAAGFAPVVITAAELADPEAARFFGEEAGALMVFGSGELNREEAAAIETYVEAGGAALFAVSPNRVTIGGDWSATKSGSRDRLLPVLDAWGLTVGAGLVQDLSCYAMKLQDDSGAKTSRNYPLWVTLEANSPAPTRIFWGSPITVWDEGTCRELLKTTPASWIQTSDESGAFVTNPFLVSPVPPVGTKTGQFVVAASIEGTLKGYYNTDSPFSSRVVVIGDQYFAADALMDYTQSSGNLDFLVNSLLFLTGDEGLLAVKTRGAFSTRLFADEAALTAGAIPAMMFSGLAIPILFGAGTAFTVRKTRERIKRESTRKPRRTLKKRGGVKIAALLFFAVSVFGAVKHIQSRPQTATFAIENKPVHKIRITRNTDTVTLVKRGSLWFVAKDDIFAPASPGKVEGFITELAKTRKAQVVKKTGEQAGKTGGLQVSFNGGGLITFGGTDLTGEHITLTDEGGKTYRIANAFSAYLSADITPWADLSLVPQAALIRTGTDIQGFRRDGVTTAPSPSLLSLRGGAIVPPPDPDGNTAVTRLLIQGGNGAEVILEVVPLEKGYVVIPQITAGPGTHEDTALALRTLNYGISVSEWTQERL